MPSKSAGKPHTILVACGTAIATSTHVAIKVKELLAERGLQVHTIQCRVTEVPAYAPDVDLVLSTAQVPYNIEAPVVNALPFLTGIGLTEVIDQIENALRTT